MCVDGETVHSVAPWLCVRRCVSAGLLISVSARVAQAADAGSSVRSSIGRERRGRLAARPERQAPRGARASVGAARRRARAAVRRLAAPHPRRPRRPGQRRGEERFALITMRDFAEKLGGKIGAYRIGFWPGERRKLAVDRVRESRGVHRGHPGERGHPRFGAFPPPRLPDARPAGRVAEVPGAAGPACG